MLLHCHAGCTLDAILSAAHLATADLFPEAATTGPTIVATYKYADEGGQHLYDVVRFSPKDFRMRAASGAWSTRGIRRVLYGLPELQGELHTYIVEGEKDVDRLRSLGLTATSAPSGAGKWQAGYTQQLTGAGIERVIVLPDNDDPGRAHAEHVARTCHAAGLTVQIVALPNLPQKGDISDWLDAGGTREQLVALVEAAPLYEPTQPSGPELAALGDFVAEPDEAHARRVAQAYDTERAKRDARRQLAAEDRGAITTPAIESLRDRLARPRVITPWRIEGWQQQGQRVMFPAQFKAGKTTAKGNVIRSLVDGDLFLDRYPVVPIEGTVVDCDFEMGDSQITDWYAATSIRNTDRVIVVAMRGRAAAFNILDPAARAEWAARLRRLRCAYLIIDCLRPIMDALGLDEHRDGGRLLVALDALLSEAEIPEALVIHHMGHAGERSRGDSRFRDWPDVEWRLMRQDDDPASPRFIAAYGRDVEIPESQLDFDPLTRRLTIAGGSRRDAKSAEVLADIMTVLQESSGPMSGRAIKAALKDSDHGRDTIDTALKLGARGDDLIVQSGPHNSKLYLPGSSVRVSGSVRAVSGEITGHPVNTSVRVSGALYKARTLGHSELEAQTLGHSEPEEENADDLDTY
ncbi:MAG: AAA family ATPase [Acidobacteriota bacterium]|nr:AAA family ATPase [Acidobacteriota bacterium]